MAVIRKYLTLRLEQSDWEVPYPNRRSQSNNTSSSIVVVPMLSKVTRAPADELC